MKTLYLTKYTSKAASSRMRSFQYFPYLEKAGFRVEAKPFFSEKYINDFYAGKKNIPEILKNFEECYLFDHKIPFGQLLEEIIQFIDAYKKIDGETIRTKALRYFSLESAAESYLRTLASCQNLKP